MKICHALLFHEWSNGPKFWARETSVSHNGMSQDADPGTFFSGECRKELFNETLDWAPDSFVPATMSSSITPGTMGRRDYYARFEMLCGITLFI